MNKGEAVNTDQRATTSVGPYTVYSAGGLFTQDELATNILLKEAIWRLSNGKFQLYLPQSMELQELDRPNVEAYVRNVDLLAVVRSDIILARFDGVQLDAGTVVEFAIGKSLGKPTVILRCDFRRLYGTGRGEPYSLMAKNWPRTIDIHLDSFVVWSSLYSEERQALMGSDKAESMMKAEFSTVQRSIDEIAKQVIAGMEAVVEIKSPYPPEYQELVYEAARFSPGSSFDQLLTESELDDIIQRLKKNGTL